MRLWYQETVMDRKQSWGGVTALSLYHSRVTQDSFPPTESPMEC